MKSKHITLLEYALIITMAIFFYFCYSNTIFADATNGYQIFKSTDTTDPVSTESTLSSAFAYINSNGAADSWIIKVTGDDPNTGNAAVLNSPGTTVTLTSDSSIHTLYQTNAGVRHVNITSGTLIMNSISLNGSGTGGGVSLGTGAGLVLNAGATIQNAKASQGGGIMCNGTGTVTLNSGSRIMNCQSTFKGTGGSGAGIYSAGAVTLNDGALISGNTANGGKGGGLAICDSSGSLVMNGGEITNNTVTGVSSDFQGGGVTIYGSGAIFTMYGGKITGNKADVGAGVSLWYVSAANTFTMYGGEISNNDTSFVSGVSGYHGFGGGIFGWGWGSNIINIKDGIISNNVAREGGGIMTYTEDSCVSVGGNARVYGNQATWGGGIFSEGNGSSINDNADIYSNTAGYGGGIYINKGILTLNNKASVSKNSATSGAGVYARSNFTMNDNTSITGNTSSSNGAGICARASIIMNDNASINSNVSDQQGGGVLLTSASVFSMNGGTITANEARTLGGGISMTGPSPTFTMNASGKPKLYGNFADTGADDLYSNGQSTSATLITVGQMDLPQYIHATHWYHDNDNARYRDFNSTKTLYGDPFLSGISGEIKLTIGLTYDVTFDSKGGSDISDITGITPNATISKPACPIYKGYTFEGWYVDKDCTVAWDFNSDKVTKNITLYAKWKETTQPSVTTESNRPDTGDNSMRMLYIMGGISITLLIVLAALKGKK